MLNPRFLPNYSSDSKSRDSTVLLPEELPLPEDDDELPEDEPPEDELPFPEDEPLFPEDLPDDELLPGDDVLPEDFDSVFCSGFAVALLDDDFGFSGLSVVILSAS